MQGFLRFQVLHKNAFLQNFLMAVKLKTTSIVQWKIERSKMSTAEFVFAITVS